MPGWVKIVLIVVLVVVVLVVGAVSAGIYYVSTHKDAWLAKAKTVTAEGRNFGRGTDNQGCVDEGISRYKKDPGIGSLMSHSLFMPPCLAASKPTPGFCDEVPAPTEFLKTARWKSEQCSRVDLAKDSQCPNLFTPVQQFCEQNGSRPKGHEGS